MSWWKWKKTRLWAMSWQSRINKRAVEALEVVSFADGGDLFEMVPAVYELEHTPLVDVERAEDGMAGELAEGAEDRLGFNQ